MTTINDKWISDLKKVAQDKAKALNLVAEADRRIAALVNAVVGAVATETQPAVDHGSVAVSGSNGDNTSEKILALLQASPSKKWRYQEIADQVPGPKIATIRSLLYRLEGKQKVVKAGRGKYKAAQQAEQAQ
jgi:hypothetical protein